MMGVEATTPSLPHRGGASFLTQDEALSPEPERLSRHLRAQGLSAVPLVGDLRILEYRKHLEVLRV